MPRVKGERKLEILKALAQMLEAPRWEKITTAALAAKLDVSEAALYRHFASKAQMYEGLIEFIENSVFTLANKITSDETDGRKQADRLLEPVDIWRAYRRLASDKVRGNPAGTLADIVMLVRYALGCLHQYAKSGFAKKPVEGYAAQRSHLSA